MPVAGLAPLADSATALDEYEYVFEDVWQSRTHPDPELYSPVYDGRTDHENDAFPYVQRDHLRLLLQMMQSVINIWLRQITDDLRPKDETVVLDSLCSQILDMPSARKPDLACSNDFMYEACRLTSVLMVQSVEQFVSWRDAAQGTTLVAEIKAALAKTELDGLWGKNIGLLYWVVLVLHCAAFETREYPFAHALQTRIHFQLTYEYRDWHGAVKPMLVLKDVMCVP
ncbi:hypothetical protein EDD37DRAFT_497953 [Exophiala viscosa]|uniref:Uncharacterized protein n=1 Tax=Exophiala viscosa TaxID=2486360 RepID=A0AAN6IFJ6_9EURO|nr:hypothetical protein EDD36DRAFT_192778 [Exophiala viscosa]KAI1621853.1 hypothetical protein EDD37DRAFT_497953 [Exophiala viscosa]